MLGRSRTVGAPAPHRWSSLSRPGSSRAHGPSLRTCSLRCSRAVGAPAPHRWSSLSRPGCPGRKGLVAGERPGRAPSAPPHPSGGRACRDPVFPGARALAAAVLPAVLARSRRHRTPPVVELVETRSSRAHGPSLRTCSLRCSRAVGANAPLRWSSLSRPGLPGRTGPSLRPCSLRCSRQPSCLWDRGVHADCRARPCRPRLARPGAARRVVLDPAGPGGAAGRAVATRRGAVRVAAGQRDVPHRRDARRALPGRTSTISRSRSPVSTSTSSLRAGPSRSSPARRTSTARSGRDRGCYVRDPDGNGIELRTY